jgi:L-lactate utilization protein LutB
MDNSVKKYWAVKLNTCKKALEANSFQVFLADDAIHARDIVLGELLPAISPRTVSWGDSLTLYSIGVLDELRGRPDIHLIETFDKKIPREELIERRRQALLVDLFFTGSNAVTETGVLVNLDMVGNRVAAVTFGPRHVIITVGRNKVVADVQDAMKRIRNYAAPINAIRHEKFKTPCKKTASCMDCSSPDRICNTWCITAKSFPKGRIKVILINGDLGL